MFLTVIALVLINVYYYQGRQELLYDISNQKLLMMTKMLNKIENNRIHFYLPLFSKLTKKLYDKNVTDIESNAQVDSYLHDFEYYLKKSDSDFMQFNIYNDKGRILYECIDKKLNCKVENNPVLDQSINTDSFVDGYVPTKDGYYLSFIAPLRLKDRTLYAEFAFKADGNIHQSTRAGRYKYALYMNNDMSKNTNLRESDDVGKLVVSNSKLFKKLNLDQDFIYKYANMDRILHVGDRYYLFYQFDIERPFQKNFAQLIVASNVTAIIEQNYKTILQLSIFSFIILGIIFAILYFYLSKLTRKLIKDEQKIVAQSIQMKAVMDNSDALIVLMEDHDIILANHPFLHFFNTSTLEEFMELNINFSDEFIVDDTNSQDDMKNVFWLEKLLTHGAKDNIVAMKHHKTDEKYYFSIRITVLDQEYHRYVVAFNDITLLYKDAQKDQYKARHDELTKVYNRHFFTELVEAEINKPNQQHQLLTLVMFDLDHFKAVNDNYGHQKGDEVLQIFADAIQSHIRSSDIFARWGGEEFVLLLNGTLPDKAKIVTEHLREVIEKLEIDEVGHITCSIGISQYHIGDSLKEWISRSDQALYSAKENGRNRVEVG
jgi:diguanylate cyclase (GGDEF)-like protein